MALTDVAIRALKPREKPYKKGDERGLYLLVQPNGARYWRMKYRIQGKEKLLSLGVYPEVSLKEARERLDQERARLRQGDDPSEARKARNTPEPAVASDTFESVAKEWFRKQESGWSPGHAKTVMARLDNYVLPWLGGTAINRVTAADVLAVLERIQNKGAIETAHRVKGICQLLFDFAVSMNRCTTNPCSHLGRSIAATTPEHMAAITDPKEVGALLRALDSYKGHLITRCALRLAPLTFVRPGELRHAEWSEIDLDGALWKIPAERMKKKRIHLVPLATQAIQVLEDIRPLTGQVRYVFPSTRSIHRPMSENTVLSALRNLGYKKDEMTGHGFRGTASTLLYESGLWDEDVIEMQLAHKERNKSKAAYNHAKYLDKRREMMQWWADHLDGLKASSS